MTKKRFVRLWRGAGVSEKVICCFTTGIAKGWFSFFQSYDEAFYYFIETIAKQYNNRSVQWPKEILHYYLNRLPVATLPLPSDDDWLWDEEEP